MENNKAKAIKPNGSGIKPAKKIMPISDDEIKELANKCYIHKPEKNKIYWKGMNEKCFIRTCQSLRDNDGWSKTRIMDLCYKDESKECDLLKLKGILVEADIFKIGNKSIGKYTSSELRAYIIKNWQKFEPIMKDHGILKGNIISDANLKPNMNKLVLFH